MAIETNEMIDVQTLPPFKRFIMTIGNLPTSYLESMTYAELLMWFCNYLQETVIPTVNNNGQAVEELQNLYIQLKEYIDESFTDLNVQTEINNKLNAMVEDGTMDEIINQEIFGELNSKVNTIDSNVLTELVVIGDSYSVLNNSNWAEKVASQLHLTLHKLTQSSMGYTPAIIETVFNDKLNEIDSSYANKVKYLICYGGINDTGTSSASTITTAVTTFCTNAKLKCPNAQILIIGPQASATQFKMAKYKKCANAIRKGAITGGCSYCDARDWLINAGYPYTMTYQNDYLHPSNLGFDIIASKVLSVINNSVKDTYDVTITLGSGFVNPTVVTKMCDGYCHFHITCADTNVTTGTIIGTWSNSNNEYSFSYSLTYFPVFDYINGTFKGLVRFKNNGDIQYVGTTLSQTASIIIGDLYIAQIEES